MADQMREAGRVLATGATKARATGVCPACRGVIHVGSRIALVAGRGFVHSWCVVRATSEEAQP